MPDTLTKTVQLSSPESLQATPSSPLDIPQYLLRETKSRLQFLCALAFLVALTFGLFTEFSNTAALGGRAHKWTLISIFFIVSLLTVFLCRSRIQRASFFLDLALFYEVVTAVCLALLINRNPWPDISDFPAWSPVAVWVLVVPMIVPNVLSRIFLASLFAAAADPAAVFYFALQGDIPLPEMKSLLQRFLPNFVVIVPAIAISRILDRLGASLAQARAMGSYRLIRKLGEGGMGEVWMANHRFLARLAAVKLIRPQALAEDSSEDTLVTLHRFEREARATAGLRSPHTVSVYDFGVSSEGAFYYVMEYLEGLDLKAMVQQFGPQPPERVAFILRQVCHSLHEAHMQCLIHRDIKPSNIIACRYGGDDDFIKVLDFGVAKRRLATEPTDRSLEDAGLSPGTPAYMAPEATLDSATVDHRADIYALGCVAFWLLTGRFVFSGDDYREVLRKHVEEQPATPSSLSPFESSRLLDDIVLACLAKNPEERPPTIADLMESLNAIRFQPRWTPARATQWWEENTTIEKNWACRFEPPS